MKKLILAILILALVPSLAVAQGQEVASWVWDEATLEWIECSVPAYLDSSVLARAYRTGGITDDCNKPYWQIEFRIYAEIAQWIWFHMTGTDWHWYVRKPGNYAADCISFEIKSNQAVEIDYEEFDSLRYQPDPDKPNPNLYFPSPIPIYYCFLDVTAPPVKSDAAWIPGILLNDPANFDTVYDEEDLHQAPGKQFKLWNYIHVDSCHSACMYSDTAYISLNLLCQKPWIDSLGYFDTTYSYGSIP